MHARDRIRALVLLFVMSSMACAGGSDQGDSGRSQTAEAGQRTDAGVLGGINSPCWDNSECQSPLGCLFWSGYCAQGRCSECPTTFDASLYQICDCEGRVREKGCADYAWSHTVSSDASTCTPRGVDGGPLDAMAGD